MEITRKIKREQKELSKTGRKDGLKSKTVRENVLVF